MKANPGLDPGLQREAVAASLPAFFPHGAGKPWGWQSPPAWEAYGAWMLHNGLLSRPAVAQRAFTNDLLPGQGF
jgi:hypothetical protein